MKIFFTLSFLVASLASTAQVQFPNLSPEGQLNQEVGYTHFTVRYERPAARKRKIMGGLVPYDKMWRTGAGKCSTIQFDQPVKINHQPVAAGIYALATVPSAREWTILLNADTSRIYYQDSDYDKKTEAARVTAKPVATSQFYESFTIDLDVVHNNVQVTLSWENTQVSFLIETNTDELIENKIQAALKLNPNDADVLSMAAFYYEMNNIKIEEASTFIKKAMALKEDRWFFRLAVDIAVKKKDYKEALRMAEASISFLERTKPVEWPESIAGYRDEIKKISRMK